MDPNAVQGTGLLRVGNCGGRPRDTGSEASKAKAPLGYKKKTTHTPADTKGCRKKKRQKSGSIKLDSLTTQRKSDVCGAGDYMLWLIAGNERLVC